MKRYWLLFSQVVTVLFAVWFVLVTLKPEWLNRRPSLQGVTLLEAPSNAPGTVMPGSMSPAAKSAAPAVVSANVVLVAVAAVYEAAVKHVAVLAMAVTAPKK